MIAKYIKQLDDGQIIDEKQILDDVNKIIIKNPNLYSAYILRGRLYARQKLYQQALEDFNKSIQINSKNCEGYLQRAKVLEEMKKIEDAIQDYTKAINCDSSKMTCYMNRGVLYQEIKQYNNALIDFSKAIAFDPKQADAYYSRGVILKQQNKLDDSINDFTKAISLNPKNENIYYNRGNAFQQYNKLNDAIRDYTKAIQLNPKKTKAYYNRGVVFKKIGKLDDAIKDFTKAIQLDPYKANAFYTRATVFKELNNFDNAIKDYLKAIEIQPNNPLFLSNVGQYYLSQNQPQKAHKFIRNAIEVLNTTNKQKLIEKYNINQENIEYVSKTVKHLEVIEYKLQQIQNNNTYGSEDKLLIKSIQDGLNKNSFDEKSRSQNLQNTVLQCLKDHDQRLEKIEQSEVLKIENTLKSLMEPQNSNKKHYYNSFCPRILAYLEACVLVETGFIQMNNNKAIETKAEQFVDNINQGMRFVAPMLGAVPIVGPALEILFDLFDYGVEKYKERKLNEKIQNIVNVIKCKGGAQIQKEQYQLAAFQSMNKITEQDLNISDLEYYNQVQKIIALELKQIPYAKNQYWQLGVYHCIIVLKYIEKESESIIADENLLLRDIILKGLKMRQKKNDVIVKSFETK